MPLLFFMQMLLMAHLKIVYGGQTSNGQWCLSSSVTLHNGPVTLRPVKAIPCYYYHFYKQIL